MAITSTVWMIHRFTNPRTGVRGNLTLDEDVLRFEPAIGGAPTSIRLEDVVDVDRVAASPVLTLHLVPPHRTPRGPVLLRRTPLPVRQAGQDHASGRRFVPPRRGLGMGQGHRRGPGRRMG